MVVVGKKSARDVVYDSVERADRALKNESALDPGVRSLAMRFKGALTDHHCNSRI